jgi:hypothetical protein
MAYTNIDDPSAYFQTAIYTGTGSNNAITNTGNSDMQPDYIWFKTRSNAAGFLNIDSTRGVDSLISSSQADPVFVESNNDLESFNSNGFTVGTGSSGRINTNTRTYVAWQWKANGGTTASNTDGDITSTVQANTDAGFSIITYTGSGTTNDTIGHGLGVEPDIAIFKRTSVANGNWDVQQSSGGVTGTAAFRHTLNLTDGIATNVLSSFSSSTIGLSTGGDAQKNISGSTYVCYAFKAVQGYSKFGTYYGNGSTNGEFVYLGFKPALVIVKVLSDPNYGWVMADNARGAFNENDPSVYANSSDAETTNDFNGDFLSNGFKLRGSTYPANSGGTNTFSYFAWAENPFVTSTGIPTTAR